MADKIELIIDDVNSTNFGKSLGILRNSNFNKYTTIVRQEDVLRSIFDEKESKIQTNEIFLQNLVNLLQSLTTRGFTTYEIVNYIARMFRDDSLTQETKNIINASLQIVHSDYENQKILKTDLYNNVKEILFNHTDERDIGRGVYLEDSFEDIVDSKKHKRDIKVLGVYGNYSTITQDLAEKRKLFSEEFDSTTINTNIKNPSKKNPSFSSILITNPNFRIGTRNSLELSTFFNTISNIELARSYPYFNATFILPQVNTTDKKNDIKSSTINQFLFGTKADSETTDIYKKLMPGDIISVGVYEGNIRTNMSLFTTPQSMVNLDEPIGHAINNYRKIKELRVTSVIDSTQPFMTIKSFTLNSAPTKGLIGYKSGKLSLTLHDRSRMADIAPFVKPDLFGVFGAEIALEYGWANPDENNEKENPLGAFIGNSKIIEKYSIINSSMNIETNGIVNIELSIAMKGSNDFKNTSLSTYSKDRVQKGEIRAYVTSINESREVLGIKNQIGNFSTIFAYEDDILSDRNRIGGSSKNAIVEIFNKYGFLFDPGFDPKQQINIKTDQIDATRAIVTIKEDTSLIASKQTLFLKLISTEIKAKEEGGGDTQYIISGDIISSSSGANPVIYDEISNIIDNIKKLMILLRRVNEEDNLEAEIEHQFLNKVIGGIKYFDPFYPHRVLDVISNVSDYVSFGSIINSLLCSHIVSTRQFDEVQTIFYNANVYAGGMAAKNLSEFLVKKSLLLELLENILSGRKIVTLESIVSQILLKCIQNNDNISLGISDLYVERQSLKDVVRVRNPDKKQFTTSKQDKLYFIYHGKNPDTDEERASVKFILPIIKMNFDCITSESDKQKSILRISIFDANDTPFSQTSTIMDNIYSGDIDAATKNLSQTRQDFESGNLSIRLYKEKIKRAHKLLEEKGILKKRSGGKGYTLETTNLGTGIKRYAKIKEIYKEIYPSLTFGTQNTAIISANVSTINENKLNTVYISRPDRNNVNELNNRVYSDLPLRILPAQANVELIGCPWVNFGQFVFLDFGTGTTIDNKYNITGITHNFSPGKFTTSLNLSYGDQYGKFDNATDIISESLKVISESSPLAQQSQTDSPVSKTSIIIDKDYINNENYRDEYSQLDESSDNSIKYKTNFLESDNISIDTKIAICSFFENTFIRRVFEQYMTYREKNKNIWPNSTFYDYLRNSFKREYSIKFITSLSSAPDFAPYKFNFKNTPIVSPAKGEVPSANLYNIKKNLNLFLPHNSEISLEINDLENVIFADTDFEIDFSKSKNMIQILYNGLPEDQKEYFIGQAYVDIMTNSEFQEAFLLNHLPATEDESRSEDFLRSGYSIKNIMFFEAKYNMANTEDTGAAKQYKLFYSDFMKGESSFTLKTKSEYKGEIKSSDSTSTSRILGITHLNDVGISIEEEISLDKFYDYDAGQNPFDRSYANDTSPKEAKKFKTEYDIENSILKFKPDPAVQESLESVHISSTLGTKLRLHKNIDEFYTISTSDLIAFINTTFSKMSEIISAFRNEYSNLRSDETDLRSTSSQAVSAPLPVSRVGDLGGGARLFATSRSQGGFRPNPVEDLSQYRDLQIKIESYITDTIKKVQDSYIAVEDIVNFDKMFVVPEQQNTAIAEIQKGLYNLPILKSTSNVNETILTLPNIALNLEAAAAKNVIDEIPLLYTVEELVANYTENDTLSYAKKYKNFRPLIVKSGPRIFSRPLKEMRNININNIQKGRKYPIQPKLFKIVETAINILNKEINKGEITTIYSNIRGIINSAGSEPYWSYEQATGKSRASKTIRHDLGFAIDVTLQATKKDATTTTLKIQIDNDQTIDKLQPKENSEAFAQQSIIEQFFKILKSLGVYGIGADKQYNDGISFHVDIFNQNAQIKEGKYNKYFNNGTIIKPVFGDERFMSWGKSDDGVIGHNYANEWLKTIINDD